MEIKRRLFNFTVVSNCQVYISSRVKTCPCESRAAIHTFSFQVSDKLRWLHFQKTTKINAQLQSHFQVFCAKSQIHDKQMSPERYNSTVSVCRPKSYLNFVKSLNWTVLRKPNCTDPLLNFGHLCLHYVHSMYDLSDYLYSIIVVISPNGLI